MSKISGCRFTEGCEAIDLEPAIDTGDVASFDLYHFAGLQPLEHTNQRPLADPQRHYHPLLGRLHRRDVVSSELPQR
jgi:hypothetical protein